MKLITPLQCKAGRIVADLSQDQLAELSGISKAAIQKFEKGDGDPRQSTIANLCIALESQGVEFLDGEGVRPKTGNIREFTGEKAHRQLLDEIYHDMKEAGGEILIKGVDEFKWDSGDDKAFLDNHISRLLKANVTERLLVSDKFPFTATHNHWYRKIPSKYFSSHTQWIWAGKVAMVTWGTPEKITVIENKQLFESECKQFNFIWDNGQPLD